jgi:hypothetical protein
MGQELSHQDDPLAPEKRRIRNSPGRFSFAYFSLAKHKITGLILHSAAARRVSAMDGANE